jgi:rod shape determining protein RodA
MISVEKKVRFDWYLFASVLILVILGTLAIYSSTTFLSFKERIIRTHFIAIFLGILFMLGMWILDYQLLEENSTKIYLFSLLLLVGVLFFGVTDKGSKSWFRLPFFSIQPSEISRLGLMIFVASYLSKNREDVKELGGIIKLSIYILPFFALMIKQPDFSGILITFFPLLVMLIVAGINMVYIYVFVIYLIVASIIPVLNVLIYLKPELINIFMFDLIYSISFWSYNMFVAIFIMGVIIFGIWYLVNKFNPLIKLSYFSIVFLLVVGGYVSGVFIKNQIKDYQYKRIISFINPYSDPRGAGYNIIQARIALGSGGLKGKGLFLGTQSRLGFIPEKHTDFIFSVIGEELGIGGSFIIFSAYMILLKRIKNIIMLARTSFGYYLGCGFAGLFMGYFFINIGMILGFFPVAGIPLPFVSYGGSNLVVSFMMIGILNSIYARRLTVG